MNEIKSTMQELHAKLFNDLDAKLFILIKERCDDKGFEFKRDRLIELSGPQEASLWYYQTDGETLLH